MKFFLPNLCLLLLASFLTSGAVLAQCESSLISNGSFENSAFSDWGNWHDNSPDAYSFGTSSESIDGDSSAVINVLVGTDNIPGTQGGEFNSRPQVNPVIGGEVYTIRFFAKSTLADAKVIVYLKDEFDGFTQLHSESFTVGTEWTEVTSTWTADTDRADIHLELKVYNADIHVPYSIYFDEVSICPLEEPTAATNTCADNLLTNPGFEDGANVGWWNWHDNSPDAYSFETSSESFVGTSSAVVNVLVDTDSIPGTYGGEFNSRPQSNPVIGGQVYTIRFFAKSTIDDAIVTLYLKDEFDGFTQLHSEAATVGTEWTEVTSTWTADIDRPDIHLELKVYNADIHVPYSVYLDEVSICPQEISTGTKTCEDNLVSNPGFEDGANVDWWNYHGGDETDYAFTTGTEGYVGTASAKISVLKPGADLTGPGEYNSRPQLSPVAAGQNYKVSLWSKSTLDNTKLQVLVKDEFDNFTTIGNVEAEVGTDWTEVSFIFENETARDDVHIEIKTSSTEFTETYEVWIDEVAICATDEEPGGGGGVTPTIPVFFGELSNFVSCATNLAPEFSAEDMVNDGMGWDLWDGSGTEELANFELDTDRPYSGDVSMRIDVFADNDVANFHHRFGNDIVIEAGQEYTITMWMRSDIPAGDSLRSFTRVTNDTDWASQGATDFVTTSNEWFNYSYTFVADADWDNGFVDLNFYRMNGFTDAYSVWIDDVRMCDSGDATTGTDNLEELGLTFLLAPNPAVPGVNSYLDLTSERALNNANLVLFDMLGRNVWSRSTNITPGEQRIEIPTGGLAAGIYLLNVHHQGYVHNLKLQVSGRR